MDGVKPVSVGYGSILRIPAGVGCVGRIQIKPQPVISIRNGSRLGRGGMRALVEYLPPQKVGASGSPNRHHSLADRILARTSHPSVAPRKFAICNHKFNIGYWYYGADHIS